MSSSEGAGRLGGGTGSGGRTGLVDTDRPVSPAKGLGVAGMGGGACGVARNMEAAMSETLLPWPTMVRSPAQEASTMGLSVCQFDRKDFLCTASCGSLGMDPDSMLHEKKCAAGMDGNKCCPSCTSASFTCIASLPGGQPRGSDIMRKQGQHPRLAVWKRLSCAGQMRRPAARHALQPHTKIMTSSRGRLGNLSSHQHAGRIAWTRLW